MNDFTTAKSDYLKILDLYMSSSRKKVYELAGVSNQIYLLLTLLFISSLTAGSLSITGSFSINYLISILVVISFIFSGYSYYLVMFKVSKVLKSKFTLDIDDFLKFND